MALDYDWQRLESGNAHPDDLVDFDIDLGCGTIPKGRIGIDRYPTPEVPDLIVVELDDVNVRLPFEDSSIDSIITHHCLEHIGAGFLPLMEECYRILRHQGLFRIIVPLFPSKSAVEDPDHERYFMRDTFMSFGGTPGDTPSNCWLASFSVPYTNARFDVGEPDCTPAEGDVWEQARELRVSMRARKDG